MKAKQNFLGGKDREEVRSQGWKEAQKAVLRNTETLQGACPAKKEATTYPRTSSLRVRFQGQRPIGLARVLCLPGD